MGKTKYMGKNKALSKARHSFVRLKSVVIGATSLLLSTALFTSPASADVIDRPFFNVLGLVIVIGGNDFIDNGGIGPVAVDFNLLNPANSGSAADDIISVNGVPVNANSAGLLPVYSENGGGIEMQINDPVTGGVFTSAPPHQLLDPGDSFTEFQIDDTTDIDLLNRGNRASRFMIASNVPFDIYAHSDNMVNEGDFANLDLGNIRYRLRVQRAGGNVAAGTRWGDMAQDPSVGGNGVVIGHNNSFRLDDIEGAPVKVFDGGRRTAAQPGSILQQAVSFQSRYNLVGAGNIANGYDFSMGTGLLAADVTYTVYVP